MLHAHSISEAQLYLKITPCEKCRTSTASCEESGRPTPVSGNVKVLRLDGPCPSCGVQQHMDFVIHHKDDSKSNRHPTAINPTENSSMIIDVGQWLTLSQLLIQESRSEGNRSLARLLNLQAAQCLDEALKFYDDPDNDLPPKEAFYCESSSRRFREFPQQFSRERLVGERRKLPVPFDDSNSNHADE